MMKMKEGSLVQLTLPTRLFPCFKDIQKQPEKHQVHQNPYSTSLVLVKYLKAPQTQSPLQSVEHYVTHNPFCSSGLTGECSPKFCSWRISSQVT